MCLWSTALSFLCSIFYLKSVHPLVQDLNGLFQKLQLHPLKKTSKILVKDLGIPRREFCLCETGNSKNCKKKKKEKMGIPTFCIKNYEKCTNFHFVPKLLEFWEFRCHFSPLKQQQQQKKRFFFFLFWGEGIPNKCG